MELIRKGAASCFCNPEGSVAPQIALITGFLLTLAVLFAGPLAAERPGDPGSPPPERVAHAGGGLDGRTYWNSLEALEANYAKGFRAFELDIHWSSDDRLVFVHDWGRTFRALYGRYRPTWAKRVLASLTGSRPRPSREEYFAKGAARGFTPLSLERLAAWIEQRPDALVITDVKEDNLRALARIRLRYPALAERMIPQIYRFGEFGPVTALGFPRVILTLYRLEATDAEILAFAGRVRPFAVTMPRKTALESDLAGRLHELGIFVYAHTINSGQTVRALRKLGVKGIYTDWLPPRGFGHGTSDQDSAISTE
ncbi:MAG: hypothetical protein IID61_05785 [SAR324 cluster bacterium]|nr:hypothetical protein [SAR324 cluster bacterium]